MSSLCGSNGRKDFGNGQTVPSDLKAFRPTLTFPLLPNRRFVTSGGVTFCNLHLTFATRCGCLDGLKDAKLVTKKPKFPLLRCHRCFCLTDKLVPFTVPWSVAFVKGALDLLGKGVCVDCYGELVRKTWRAWMRYRFPYITLKPMPLWCFPAWASLGSGNKERR